VIDVLTSLTLAAMPWAVLIAVSVWALWRDRGR
jgi:hypothetical protein